MTSLMDELRADSRKMNACAACEWIAALPKAEQAEWDTACADRSFTHASIFRAIQRRNGRVGRGSIENHRLNAHRT